MKPSDNEIRDETEASTSEPQADELKREFLRRFGKYAVTAPAVLYLLMSPRTSAATNSDGAPG